ncbi:MAG: sel1 repeat family protein [Elusimicrobiota bacterium]|jgi:TPR repeat protein|nr:sel1 repeat family protein [Elusimicrobiota bacterium]
MKKLIFTFLFCGLFLMACSNGDSESKTGFFSNIKNKFSSIKKSYIASKQDITKIDDIFSQGLYAQAYDMYFDLASKGNAQAEYKLGAMLAMGQGINKNMVEAIKWWQLAAEHGNQIAQYNLGVLYSKGEGVALDTQAALKWFEQSAQQGFASAQYALGVIYMDGVGVVKNEQVGLQWMQKAAAQGDQQAIAELKSLGVQQ